MQLFSARRMSSACSWSTQKTIVLANGSVFVMKSVRWRAIASVRLLSATERSKSLVPYSWSGISRPYRSRSPFDRSPAGRVDGRDDAVNPVRRQEAVVDAVAQAVRVDRVAEVAVGVLCCRRAAAWPSFRAARPG